MLCRAVPAANHHLTRRGYDVKITYNREACQGHNRCYMLAPELFDVDDEGYAILLVEGDVPAELEEKAQLTVDNCPEFAIEVA